MLTATMLFPMAASLALKSAIVLASARLVAYLLRGRSAAARHLVWTAAAAAVLALPFLSLSLPALRVAAPAALVPVDTGLVFQALGVAETDAASQPTAAAAFAGPLQRAPWHPGVRLWLVCAWAAGVAAAFAQMLVAYLALWRLRRAARPLRDGGQTDALTEAMGIGHPVPVWETAPGAMPMSFGFLRASVLMPADSAGWSDERRRIVLLHELAHVRRGDPATHLVARAALSLNWWNPLAWIAWREFLTERERAADDLVLAAGARASEYAGHLLGVARAMHSAPATAWAAVAMARPSQLEERLVAILDARVNRKASGRMAPVLAAIAAIVLVAPFAAVRAQEQKTVPPELDATIIAANSQKNHEILERAAAAYANLMKYDVAQTLLEKALVIRAQTSGERSVAYAVGLVKLGDLSAKRGQASEALDFYTRAVALGDRPEVASALVYLGVHAFGKRDYPAAAGYFQRALNVAPDGPQAGAAMTWMAELRQQPAAAAVNFRADSVLSRDGYLLDPVLSEELYQKAMARLTPDSFYAATTMELYARFLRQQNRAAEAQPLEARAQEIRQARLAELTQGSTSPGVFRVGNGVTAPAIMFKKDPAYSEEARAVKYQGTVVLFVEVGTDGLAHNIQVKRSLGLGLDEQAVLAVGEWKFKPGTKDGQPVTVAATIEVNFRLM